MFVEGLCDVDQSTLIILTTPKGADAPRQDFGSDLPLYIDWAVNRVTRHLVREAVYTSRGNSYLNRAGTGAN
jgi:phage baseplate assembly protein W